MKYGFCILLYLSLCFSFAFGQQENSDSTDYIIYSKVLEEFLSEVDTVSSQFIFEQKTSLDKYFIYDIETSKDSLETYLKIIPYIDFFTIKDNDAVLEETTKELLLKLISINKTPQKIEVDKFHFQNYTGKIISESKHKRIFKKKYRWERFYQEYPNAFGLLSVSKIAYLSDKKEAMFYFDYIKGGLNGAGYVVWLDLDNGKVVVKKIIRVWVS